MFSGLKQNAVLDRRGRDLVKQCAALFSLFIRIQSVQQKHRRVSALDCGTRIRNRDTVRQTDGLCLRDIVCSQNGPTSSSLYPSIRSSMVQTSP